MWLHAYCFLLKSIAYSFPSRPLNLSSYNVFLQKKKKKFIQCINCSYPYEMLKVISIEMDLGMLYGGYIFILVSTKVLFLFSKYAFSLVFVRTMLWNFINFFFSFFYIYIYIYLRNANSPFLCFFLS